MFLNREGWFVVAPERYAGENLQTVKASQVAGDYKFVNHGLAYSGDIVKSVHIRLNKDNTISGDVTGKWQLSGKYEATLTLGNEDYRGVFVRGWDAGLGGETLTFTAVSSKGESVWGIQQPDMPDRQVVKAVVEALDLGATSRVMANLNLPAQGTRGAVIAWKSSNPDVVSDTGVIYPPEAGEAGATATLTATIKKGKASATKTFTVVVAPIDPEYGLQARFSFVDNLSDSFGRFGEGVVTGDRIDRTDGTIAYADGVGGKAAVFDGNSGIKLPNGLIAGNRYSVSFWVNPQQYTPFTTAFFGANSTSSWISLVPEAWDNNTMLWSGEAWYDGATGVKLPLNEWHHVAFTVDEGAVKVYIDGEQKFAGTGFPDVFTTDAGTFSLGVNWWDPPFKGMLDELRIYDIPVTEAVIRKLAEEKR